MSAFVFRLRMQLDDKWSLTQSVITSKEKGSINSRRIRNIGCREYVLRVASNNIYIFNYDTIDDIEQLLKKNVFVQLSRIVSKIERRKAKIDATWHLIKIA